MEPDFLGRAARARALSKRYPEAREVLEFAAEVLSFQSGVDPQSPLSSLSSLVRLVEAKAPEPLRSTVIDEAGCRRALEKLVSGEDVASPRSFFARVLLQTSASREACPAHRRLPQAGALRPEGHGTAFTLVCGICLGEWSHPRGACFGCGESDEKLVSYYEAAEVPSVRVQLCERCRLYLHVIRFDVDPEAIADVDEIAALSLDVWARERGYRKLFPNVVGI